MFIGSMAIAAPAVSDSCIPIAYWRTTLASDVVLSLVLEMYETAGIWATPAEVPLKRGEEILIKGQGAADVVRSGIFIDANRVAVVNVPTPLLKSKMVLIYDRDVHVALIDLDSLRNAQIGVYLGEYYAAAEVRNLGASPFTVNSFETVVHMIAHKRLSLGAIPLSSLSSARRIMDVPARIETAPLRTQSYYHVLPKQYAHLVQRLDSVLKTVISRGTFEARLAAAQAKLWAPRKRGDP
ncbi:MAG: transporter substrate-binding domain-containing protein [Rhodospirillaceae bacterium]